jgi:hypothetical protein
MMLKISSAAAVALVVAIGPAFADRDHGRHNGFGNGHGFHGAKSHQNSGKKHGHDKRGGRHHRKDATPAPAPVPEDDGNTRPPIEG